MKQLFVIGDPVAHSLSPLLHQAMLDQTGTAYRYDVRTVRPEELPAFVRWAKDGGCAGFNVTMPHKEAILPLLDEVDATAASCGAVNTVCIREGRAIGHNTVGHNVGVITGAAVIALVLIAAGGQRQHHHQCQQQRQQLVQSILFHVFHSFSIKPISKLPRVTATRTGLPTK